MSGFSGFDRMAEALEAQNKLLAEQLEISKKLLWEASYNRRSQDVTRLAITAPVLDSVSAFAAEKQFSMLDTLAKIRDNKLSFARFGDGEFKTMLRADYKLKFQPNSADLQRALRQVFEPSDRLLLGFPHVYRDMHWSGVWCDVWGQVRPLFEQVGSAGNSHVTRPIFFESTGQEGVKAWRSIWEGQAVTVVTGEGSRFNLIPELFDNLAAAKFCYSQPVDAFSDLDRLLVELSGDDSDIILIALGPAGTVLASELSRAGRRALDIGHISDSYEHVFTGGAWPENKAVAS